MTKSRSADILIMVLAGVACVQLAAQWHARHSMPRIYARTPVPVGQLLDVPVTDDSTRTTGPLSEVDGGRCRYVVVATSTCPFCKELAAQWTVIARNDPVRQLMPDGWSALWVVADSMPAGEQLFISPFPTATYHSPIGFHAIDRVGARGVPFHVVLDRAGRVVSAGLGGELLPRAAFGRDCTIHANVDVPGFTPVADYYK